MSTWRPPARGLDTRSLKHRIKRPVIRQDLSGYSNGQPQKLRLTMELEHGAYRDRTDDLLVANQALSQLS